MGRVRPVYYKQLAKLLVEWREAKQWDQAEAASYAERRRLKGLTRQVLLRLENGQTKSPNPQALRSIAALYEKDYGWVVGLMMSERYGLPSDLLRHEDAAGSAFPQGGSDDQAAARIRELESRVEELQTYEAIVREVRPMLRDALVALGTEGGSPTAGQTTRRRDH